MKLLKTKGSEVVVYESVLQEEYFFHFKVVGDLEEFKSTYDVIVSNRLSDDLSDVQVKVYIRD